MNDVSAHAVPVSAHGRYLLRRPSGDAPAPLLAGFHGYGECAEDELERLASIPGLAGWCLCSIEALHHFYNTQGAPGACWMTSRDREQRVAENVAYVDTVLAGLFQTCSLEGTLVLHGFSQGAGMACRSAVLGRHRASGVMLLGGDIPPELDGLGRVRSVHLARGSRDPIYQEERFRRDASRFVDAGVSCRAVTFRGGHGVNREYLQSAGDFLGLFSL